MSSGVDVRQRSGIWSYFNFNNSPLPTTRNRRVSSVSHPARSLDDQFARASDRTPSAYTYRRGYDSKTKDAWMNSRQRVRYFRLGGIIAFALLLFFFLAPGERRELVEKYVEEHNPLKGGDVASEPALATNKCTKSYSSHKPLVQYVLMIDAGSTGSRIHVYRFNNCGPTPELEDEVFKQTPKIEGGSSGLSRYGADAEGAAKSLDILMDEALKHVPEKVRGCTPVAVKATAGLRKLGPELSEQILKAVRHRLETSYPFPVVAEDKGGVEVMDGKYEAVYAWITTNYLLGKIGGPGKSPTAAVFDLGGGSTQIVFEPNFKKAGGGMPKELSEGDHKYALDFGGRKFSLYQHSYLGYGLMAARNNIHLTILETLSKEHEAGDETWLSRPIVNPCLIPGLSKVVKVEIPAGHKLGGAEAKIIEVEMTGPGDGAPAQCLAIAEKTLKKEKECTLSPCAFDGVHQPSLEQTFAVEEVFLFSYFYDRIKPLGLPESFALRDLKALAHRVCQGDTSFSAWDVFHAVDGAVDELKGRPETCLDLNFMFALLHLGYEMPIDRQVRIAKKLKGNELGWCLGASLPLLETSSGWQCKIKEIS